MLCVAKTWYELRAQCSINNKYTLIDLFAVITEMQLRPIRPIP